MKLVALFAIAISIAGIAPSLASYQSDYTHLVSRDWADDPFDLDARHYDVYDRDLDIEERDDGLWGRDELDLWERASEYLDLLERSSYDEEDFLYRRAPSAAYQKLIALNHQMEIGKSYAFEMTFPLTEEMKKPGAKETPEQKRVREMQIKLGYAHKALLVGIVTPDKDFKGQLYHMTIESIYSWHVASKALEWRSDGGNPLTSKGEVKSSWTPEKIIKAGSDLNHKYERGGKYGFEQWHCGIFALELYSTLTRDPPA